MLRISSPCTMPSPPPSPSLPFCAVELQRALSEQSFGICAYSITSYSSLRAVAAVTLLEGPIVSIQLTTRGYSVHILLSRLTHGLYLTQVDPRTSPRFGNETFESLENLLQALSGTYVQKRQEALMVALEKLRY